MKKTTSDRLSITDSDGAPAGPLVDTREAGRGQFEQHHGGIYIQQSTLWMRPDVSCFLVDWTDTLTDRPPEVY
ncbi:unnamed protein product [Arctogadus glacialis]